MKTANVKEEENLSKGPVFVDIDFGSKDLVMSAGEFTTERFEEYGAQEIGTAQTTRNIIDDNNQGFRIIEEEEGTKKVERIHPKAIPDLIKKLKESNKENIQINQSDIDLIKKETGYTLVIKDKTLIEDDLKER